MNHQLYIMTASDNIYCVGINDNSNNENYNKYNNNNI